MLNLQTRFFVKNNLLNLRRTVSDWKRGEYLNLIDKLKRNKTPKKEKEKKIHQNKKLKIKIIKVISIYYLKTK